MAVSKIDLYFMGKLTIFSDVVRALRYSKTRNIVRAIIEQFEMTSGISKIEEFIMILIYGLINELH